MLRPRILPVLLLDGTGLVKTTKFKKPVYLGDCTNAVRIFNYFEADELVFLDITATKNKKGPQIDLIAKISDECFMPLAYGGGIRNMKDVRELFCAGVEKVVVNTYAVENPEFLSEIVKEYGAQAVVVSIDAKKEKNGKYQVYTEGGTKPTGLDPVSWAMEVEKFGAGEIIINSIDRDGTMAGYDIELVKSVADAVQIPVVACGGAGSVKDLEKAIKKGHASAAGAGAMFVFYGERRAVLINFPDKSELEQIR